MEEQDLIELLELQRLTRELLSHLRSTFEPAEVALLLREMADGVDATASTTSGSPTRPEASGVANEASVVVHH